MELRILFGKPKSTCKIKVVNSKQDGNADKIKCKHKLKGTQIKLKCKCNNLKCKCNNLSFYKSKIQASTTHFSYFIRNHNLKGPEREGEVEEEKKKEENAKVSVSL